MRSFGFVRNLFILHCSTLMFLGAGNQSKPSLQSMIDSVSATNLTLHITKLQEAGGHRSRVNFTAGNDSGAAYIYRSFSELSSLGRVELDTFFIPSATPPLNTKPLMNIVATLEGRKEPSKVFLVGAHLDCSASRMGSTIWQQQWKTIRAPGADDNASGVAAILELARILSDTSFGFFNDYTVKFVAFGAEESGPAYSGSHAGSLHYAQEAKAKGEQILGMISVDMIGFNKNYNFLSIMSNTQSEWIGRKILAVNDSDSIGLIISEPPFVNATWSDHYSFWQQGYPGICLIEYAPPWNDGTYYKANPYYHTSSDSFETLNIELIKRVTQATLAAVVSITGTITGVPEGDGTVPEEFALNQNYPNPFNSKTVVSYQLSAASVVALKVYDILGHEVAVLVNGRQNAGSYTVEWNAENLPSGVYFFRLAARSESLRSFVETKRMHLVK